MAFVQLLAQLLKDETLGKRIVPIVADEARTFGMQTLFRQFGIYSRARPALRAGGPRRAALLPGSEGRADPRGGHHRGGRALLVARRGDRATRAHGMPMLPFYIYYSMFGFQRVGDLIWAAADSRARGFLFGGTAGPHDARRRGPAAPGRLVATSPPRRFPTAAPTTRASATSSPSIVEDGARRMLEAQEDVFYYVTRDERELSRTRRCRRARARESCAACIALRRKANAQVQLLGSGTILREVIAAADCCEKDWGIAADVWSVTQLHRAAPRRHGGRARAPRSAASARELGRAVPRAPRRARRRRERLRARRGRPDPARTCRGAYVALGTDGFGRSDTRAALRDFFEVDAKHIAVAALAALDAALAARGPGPVWDRPPWPGPPGSGSGARREPRAGRPGGDHAQDKLRASRSLQRALIGPQRRDVCVVPAAHVSRAARGRENSADCRSRSISAAGPDVPLWRGIRAARRRAGKPARSQQHRALHSTSTARASRMDAAKSSTAWASATRSSRGAHEVWRRSHVACRASARVGQRGILLSTTKPSIRRRYSPATRAQRTARGRARASSCPRALERLAADDRRDGDHRRAAAWSSSRMPATSRIGRIAWYGFAGQMTTASRSAACSASSTSSECALRRRRRTGSRAPAARSRAR